MPRARSEDPRRNAGISLTGAEIEQLDAYKEAAGLSSRSEVVAMLIGQLPTLWYDLLLQQSKA